MNNKEIVALLAMATANFPSYQERDMGATLSLWKDLLSDIPFNVAKAALIKVLATAKFWPTVAEIREAALFVTNQQGLSPAQAWGLFEQADEKYGYYRAVEAMESLPVTVQQTIKAMGGFRSLSASESPSVTRGQFLKMYEQIASREKEMSVLPQDVRELINKSAKMLPGASD